jgi:phosphoglycolate phosphatase
LTTLTPKQLVVFDCDGTLVDSKTAIYEAMTSAFVECSLTPPAAEKVWRIIGLSLDVGIAELLPAEQAHRVDDVVVAYRSFFFKQRQVRAPEPVFEGIRQCLSAISGSGALMGIATGKSRRGVDAILSALDLGHYFVTLQTADRHPGKPDPSMLRAAMAETGHGPEDTAFIGDTSFDMAMAVNAGVMGIGVAWGYHPIEELRAAGAAVIAADPSQLPAAVGCDQ